MSLRSPRLDGEPPAPVSFRTESYVGGTVFPAKSQEWGELNYALVGVAELDIEGVRYLSPPHYGIWLPPYTLHEAWIRHDVRYVTVYVARELCADLPPVPQTLSLSPLLKAILADFAIRDVGVPQTTEDLRLAQVLVDQIRLAERCESYLPLSVDALLGPVLSALQESPGDRRSLEEWARMMKTTERTLSRRCQDELGMSFNDWRQRLKLVAALAMLEADMPVRRVAQELGYGSASAFIAMFRRLTGSSPTQMRRR
ncbi:MULTISPECIES: AraC family transcriptional regulator [Rhizobium]|uniref:Helix-turn-helix transcriptional regulator n=1 Tax=Rhizobium rhododendri TaxID=2506430 RepID=A0ABY8IDM5_9HYPH|nr:MULTISPECIES: helix-turn-helix transcriptional regulator [Rhizobium]MBZ5758929.1 helix-turn-helix transcriptional regulator [Rhizobium sp. VS19-DR96]MBZ5764241.1 helix-turn-helix transcriptional regulator [Rhizobium sp. VS19-DR129.2]MBZ5771784.1 helix-turn-helix transcriptional regulator [Rhizobium sp. VS19-DRK62.2]MBZ5783529.1 helix-turn-helix transcriptional regulator [Rhizobium sp. VS19-DR121]MBZ5800977.1 helix-turn-helix transcriptional regulator [Rhizobium sp. VS19-DR181]